jgi:hypothetical protein
MTNPNEDALHDNAERIAVPAFDIVAGQVETLAEPSLVDDRVAGDTEGSESDQGEDRT